MFPSGINELAKNVPLPKYQELRILLMPIVLGDASTNPYPDCNPMLEVMAAVQPQHKGKVCYLTIDQKGVPAGKTHRRAGLHVDGYPYTEADKRMLDGGYITSGAGGIWAANAHGGTWGGGGGWGGGNSALYWHMGNGLLTVSSVEGCVAWNQEFPGEPKVEGDCEHLREHCKEECKVVLKANTLYWMSPGCVHESLPQPVDVIRTFVRLSLPSKCDWYEGCTPNPLGVKPTGKISRRRRFLDV
jgi:hypothetical protein